MRVMYVSYADEDGAGRCSCSTGIILPHPGPDLAGGGVTMRRRRAFGESESTSNILLSAIVFMRSSKTQIEEKRTTCVDVKTYSSQQTFHGTLQCSGLVLLLSKPFFVFSDLLRELRVTLLSPIRSLGHTRCSCTSSVGFGVPREEVIYG
jgi:hypothetical protein